MKIKVLKDADGEIIATFESPTPDGFIVEPVLAHGHTIEEREVPESYKTKLHLLYV